MLKLLTKKSLPLFVLVCCSFFSCERLLDIIKPTTPPKPLPTCKVIKEYNSEFQYDDQGRLTLITGYGYGNGPIVLGLRIEYDDKGHIRFAGYPTGKTGVSRHYTYDAQGRVSQIKETYSLPTYAADYDDFTYSDNKIHIKHTYTDDGSLEVKSKGETILHLQDGNIVKIIRSPTAENPQGIEITYQYGNTPNRLYDLQNTLAYVKRSYGTDMSKNLPVKGINKNGQVATFNWMLNSNGYPLNNGYTNDIVYQYECED